MPYVHHEDLITPPDATVLWRYMDFARFIALLESRALWFACIDQLEDPLEGTHTDAEIAGLRKNLKETDAESLIDGFRFWRNDEYVNCWRSGSYESLAMWDLYGKGSGIIAVKSTIGRLKQAFATYDKPVYISKVKYVDWNQAHGLDNVLVACSRKDLCYQHEAEVRAIVDRDYGVKSPLRTPGIQVPVNIEELITEVLVGPREKSWVFEMAKSVMKKYGLPQGVVASDRLIPRK